ncbi:hypothetical protein JQC92_19435 [Shewanella sp. 202IG2-18]|uniref:hypothetical protein n=1 Tax=Parashewanella hymeniacidonis TaxID=2807618 RepID=UPI00195F33BA|nr:hypothetical protein [Parashewanella hymeniacidonis]MBM7074175.1 hypothetical protein [Parashewanella hymeniacidonis]
MKCMLNLTAFTVVLALSACGSDNKESKKPIEHPKTTIITGKVISHDYLVNAKVYMDLNSDRIHNNDEPMSMTNEQGQFTLENVSELDATVNRLIAEISAETTDTAGNILPGEAAFYGYPGARIISHCSNMASYKVLQGFPLENAKNSVVEILPHCEGFGDFLAAPKNASSTSEENTQTDIIKQTAAALLAIRIQHHHYMRHVHQSTQSEKEHLKELEMMIASTQIRHIKDIMQEAMFLHEQKNTKPATTLNFSDASMAKLALNESKFALMLDKSAQDVFRTQADLVNEISTTGLFELSGRNLTGDKLLGYSERKISSALKTASVKAYQYEDGAFTLIPNSGLRNTRVLVEQNWESLTNKYALSIGDDKQLHLHNSEIPIFSSTLLAVEFPLAGYPLNITTFTDTDLNHSWGQVLADKNFPEGAKLFSYESIADYDIYSIFDARNCENKSELNDICNSVDIISSSDENITATSLDQLMSSSPSKGNIEMLTGALLTKRDGTKLIIELLPELNAANFYTTSWQGNTQTSNHLARSKWLKKTVNNKEIIIIDVPQHVRSFNPQVLRHQKVLFTVEAGFVRSGFFKVKGSTERRGQFALNKIAMDTLIQNIDPDKWQALTPPLLQSLVTPCRNGNTMMIRSYVPDASTLRTNTDVSAAIKNCVEHADNLPSMEDILVPDSSLTSYRLDGSKESVVSRDNEGNFCQAFHFNGAIRKNCGSIELSTELSGENVDSNGVLTQRWKIMPYKIEGCNLFAKTATEDDNWSPEIDGTKNFVTAKIYAIENNSTCQAE